MYFDFILIITMICESTRAHIKQYVAHVLPPEPTMHTQHEPTTNNCVDDHQE